MKTNRREPPVIVELPVGEVVRWVGLWNQTPREIASKLRRAGCVVAVLDKGPLPDVVKILRGPVKGW